jgi:hypothetical protein
VLDLHLGMGGAIFLVGAALLGIGVIRRLFAGLLNHAEQALWGLAIGWSLAAIVGYGIARLSGALNFQTFLLTALLIWAGAAVIWLPVLRTWKRSNGSPRHFVWESSFTPLAVLLAIFGPLFFHLFLTHMLQPKPGGGVFSGGESSYYDMAYHAAITTSFLHGANFPPVYTPMPPAPLLYPFLPDFFTALVMAGGANLHSSLVWTAFPLTMALTGIFYFLARRLITLIPTLSDSRASWAAALATLLFLLNGGLGFIDLPRDLQTSGKSLWHFLGSLEINYTHLPARGLVWPNVITDMLLPQRTSIFGFALGFIILTIFVVVWTGDDSPGEKIQSRKLLFVAGLIAGLLPLFHIHSYLAVGLVSGVLFFFRPRRFWLFFWLPAILLAFPRFIEFWGHAGTVGFTRFQPGWRGQAESNVPLFWFRNLGLPALLVIPAWLTASRALRLFYLSFLALLTVSLLVVFSPNDYDNLKLMTYWHAASAVLIAAWLGRLARGPLGWSCAIAFSATSIFSGTLAVLAESQSNRQMFRSEEVAAAEFVNAKTAPHSLFLTAPTLHQPVLSLAGRAVVRGPTAWLWSHGYPFAEREADVRAIYSGRDDAPELLRYYEVDYIYLGNRETEELRANHAFFEAAFPVVYRAGDIAIYDARKLREPASAHSFDYAPREYASRIDRDPSQILQEFSAIAGELYGLNKIAFGVQPRYDEFMADLRQLGRGLYAGKEGWQATLEANKRQLCHDWTQRPSFRERYDAMSNAEYVAALSTNAGSAVSPRSSPADDQVVSVETRAAILQRVSAERRPPISDYNAAYVLCHYFAYLKRNPNEAPDRDFTGYNFWYRQLERTHDYRGLTRAFLESDEYRRQ